MGLYLAGLHNDGGSLLLALSLQPFGGGDGTAPRPSERFTKKDLKRIKQEGPRFDDIAWEEGKDKDKVIPLEVLRDIKYTPEPNWGKMEKMTYFEFYQGLRERNWTSKHFKKNVSLCLLAGPCLAVQCSNQLFSQLARCRPSPGRLNSSKTRVGSCAPASGMGTAPS